MKSIRKSQIRADLLLVTRGLFASRHEAHAAILAGAVSSAGKKILKAGTLLPGSAPLQVEKGERYVSRGGVKLHGALSTLAIDPTGLVCLDAGASTGGFTDCLLQAGAGHVYAVDVGYGQFHPKLRKDPRVTLFEKTNIRYLDPESFSEKMDLVVADLSFISLTYVLPRLIHWLAPGGKILCLVKPQFELTAREVKKGVVRDEALRRKAVERVKNFALQHHLAVLGETDSTLPGPKGNREVFLLLGRRASDH